MLDLYQGDSYADKNPTWHEEDASWKATQITNMLHRNRVSFDNLCEVGCGTGEILLNLERSFGFSRARGYEVSPHAYKRAKAKETARTKFSFENVFDTTASPFDVVLVIDVIEHVEDYIGFVKQVRKLGQYKIFHVPLDLSVQSLLRESPIVRLRKDVGHLHYFFKKSALALLEDCGYMILDHAYTASRLELPNQATSSRIMRLPRKAMFALNQDLTVRILGGYSLLVLAE